MIWILKFWLRILKETTEESLFSNGVAVVLSFYEFSKIKISHSLLLNVVGTESEFYNYSPTWSEVLRSGRKKWLTSIHQVHSDSILQY